MSELNSSEWLEENGEPVMKGTSIFFEIADITGYKQVNTINIISFLAGYQIEYIFESVY